jgi:DHA2 family multidrug resistance protein
MANSPSNAAHLERAEAPPSAKPVLTTDSGEELSPYRWIILVGLITAAILEVLDTTIVNVALPQMGGNLGATREEIGWVATGYILSNVIVLPMTAWLSSRFGRKRYLTGSILLFVGASFLCGVSHSLIELVIWRIIQGSGGAALLSTAQATLREIFPREQQGTVQSLYILGVIVAPTVGPTLGGWITDNYSWSWIFFVNIPIGLISAAIVVAFLADSSFQVKSVKIDAPGVMLLASGLGSLQYVLEEGNSKDWFQDALIARLTVVAVVSLISLVIWELSPRNKQPIVNFRVLRNRDLSASLILFLALGFGLYGGTFIFPLFAQNILGFTPTVTGLMLMPGAIGTGIMAIVCGRLLNGAKAMVNPMYLVILGMGLFIFSMWDMGRLTSVSGEADVRMALIYRGLGLGMLFTPINFIAFNSLQGAEIAQGSSMLNLMRQLGGSFGIALLTTYLSKRIALHSGVLATHAAVSSPVFSQRLHAFTSLFLQKGYGAIAANQAAMKLIAGLIQREATTMSYNDAFLLIGLSVAFVSPAVLLLRPKKSGGAAGADMAH